MGMAASQVRFLSLQNRKNTIGLNLMTLSNRKTALSRDMSRVANEYNNAMNQKVLKWSNDSGVTYSDLTYDHLMKPNELNTTKPYIITDAQGRVVLDDNVIQLEDGVNSKVTYRDLAMMISSYSGHKNGEAIYDNVDNLVGGTGTGKNGVIIAEDIKSITKDGVGANIKNKAEAGAANTKKEYEIVTNSVQTVSNSLRYELMEKLGLISPAEKQEILNKEMEIYGSNESTKGPYPIGTLMGDYYLALANYEAYQNLLKDGEYNFSTSSNTPASTKKTSNPSLGDASKINYENTINGAGTTINFNGVKATSLGQVDLEKVYNPDTDSVEDLKTKAGDITNNFSYTINNGQISYSYGTSTFLDLMGTCDVLNFDGENKHLLVNHTGSKSQSWTQMYKDNSNIDLYNVHKSGHERYNKDDARKNLEKLVGEMSDDFKNIDAVQIDVAAVEKAKQSTIAFFLGDITNGGNSATRKPYGSNNHSDKIRNDASDRANKHNLIGSTSRKGGWVQGTDDYRVATVNFRNLYNTFITFYDYYKHQPNVDAITSGATYTIPPTPGAYEPVDITGVTYSDKKVFTDPTTHTQYVRLKGSIKGDDGKDHEFYDYYLTDASGNKTGNVIQRDALNPETNKWEREFYDDTNKGAGAKKYVIEKDRYDSYKETINQGTNGEELDTATEEVKAKDNNLELKYKDENGNEVKYVLHNEVGKSTYATSTTANPANILETLQKKVDETAAAKDEALKEVDTLFAEKDSKIMDYFDALFKMISKNGWVYDENVNNTNKKDESKNYLNAKLQNNMYFITEVDTLDGKDYNYATKLATNVSKVFQVYDTDAQNQALSKYESEKADINSKEKQIDIRMNKLETEQDAIKTELDSIKSIIKDNVDTTFKIFT